MKRWHAIIQSDDEAVPFHDGSHIVYVNGRYRKEDELGRLMHDFFCEEPDKMNYRALAERARHFKESKGGLANMCKLLEDMRRETAERVTKEVTKKVTEEVTREVTREVTKEVTLEVSREMARNLIKLGDLSLDKISKVTKLSLDDLKELEKEAMQPS